jgi:hypothetical protein
MFDAQAPAAESRQPKEQSGDYTDCIGADIQPIGRAITHHSLAGFDKQAEKQ